ncbi:MAG: hypothetical protein F4Z28_13420 [Gammaproteobacteria bacterium]|nr:hypothetical protein [Gammaproteobacteria bacterium]
MIVRTLKECGAPGAHFMPGLYVEAPDDSPVLKEWLFGKLVEPAGKPGKGVLVLDLQAQPIKPKPKRKKAKDD